ncbi:Uncharacterized protein dnm_049520 [Desulfonema magnum]|uniref:Uncharacterized protein n=1 Tax=Desulfonema magnum TaxID=45655 RepID=A0A975GPK8_9BACT|nr:Uncharacterized protein dnm_049520 [Desulfonema magnum]
MHSGFLQKTASLCFCTPDFCKKPLRSVFALRIFAKNRFALFLHSGFLQKTASLCFCTPDFCKKPLRSVFALRIYTKNRFENAGRGLQPRPRRSNPVRQKHS